jgi:hypothetical protein
VLATAAIAGVLAGCVGGASDEAAEGDAAPNDSKTATSNEPVTAEVTGVSPRRLPDLDQETPDQLRIKTTGPPSRRIYRLGFRSAVRNVGDGPLELVGSRPGRGTSLMTISQRIAQVGLPPTVVPDVGHMRYTISPDHRHWHYLGFEHYELQRYELRAAGASEPLRTDRKTGFCLGDRYSIARRLPAAPPEPVYTGSCARNQPGRLRLKVGISVGYGDDYAAFLEGQDLKINDLPGGRYVLVHRVNVDRGLRELLHRNNAASVLLHLSWRRGTPSVRVLERCPYTDDCDRR